MNGDTETYLFAPFIKMGRFIELVKPSFSLKPLLLNPNSLKSNSV